MEKGCSATAGRNTAYTPCEAHPCGTRCGQRRGGAEGEASSPEVFGLKCHMHPIGAVTTQLPELRFSPRLNLLKSRPVQTGPA